MLDINDHGEHHGKLTSEFDEGLPDDVADSVALSEADPNCICTRKAISDDENGER